LMRILATFLALIVLVLGGPPPAARAQLMVNELIGFGSGGAEPPAATFLQCSTGLATGSNPYTISSVNVGTATADRTTVVFVGAEDGATAFTFDGMTIGGDTATELVDDGGDQTGSSGFYAMANPAGTSENIVITASEGIQSGSSGSIYVCLWSVTGLASSTTTTVSPLALNRGSNNNSIALNSDVAAQAIVMAGCYNNNSSQTATWSGLTEREDVAVSTGAMHAADYTATAAETNRAMSVQMTGSNPGSCSLVVMR
jgi:hypothetical protein